MSGTLTITYTNVGDHDEVSRTQTGGSGEPDLTIIVSSSTIDGHVSTSKHLIGGPRDDVLVADNITIWIDGAAGNDTLTGYGSLNGQAGDDSLQGADSYNSLNGGPGNDTLDGGGGFDVIFFTDASHGVTADLRIAGPQDTGDGVDVISNVEGLIDQGGSFGDTFSGDDRSNLLMGAAGDDIIYGFGGDDTITDQGYYVDDWGQLVTSDTADYLRGGEGNDSISGGEEFDDINGNQGDDTVHGDDGDDWVVGGKDQDVLFGDQGDDLVYGNLGNDTCDGGPGGDTVRGGQGDDSLAGGDGNDWLSGDLGDDTLAGGAGADIFHSFGEAGVDRVTDFNPGEGDRVMLDPGGAYTVAQVGADTVISLGDGARTILVGVQLASLSGDWIFQG